MLKFNVCLNQGNEALNTGKSITAIHSYNFHYDRLASI